MVPFKPVPVINIPGIGELSAVAACEQMKVASQNDKVQLQKAKNMTYLKGFYDGVTITHCSAYISCFSDSLFMPR